MEDSDPPLRPRLGLKAGSALLARILPLIVLLALICHPTQITVRQWADAFVRTTGFGHAVARLVPSAHVCVSDLLFICAFVGWLVLNLREGRLARRMRRYPPALLILLACAALSVVPVLKPPGLFTGRQLVYARAATKSVQLLLLFGCTYLVLADCLRDAVWRRRLVVGFLCAAAVAIAVGVWQYAHLRPGGPAGPGVIVSPVEVDGTFGFTGEPAGPHEQAGTASNRNVLGAWASMVVPMLWALALCLKRPTARIACGAAAAGGLLLLLQGGEWFAAIVALLVVAYARSGRSFVATAGGLLVFWALVFRFAPEQHGMVLTDSLMLRKAYDRFHTLPLYGGARGAEGSVPPARLSTNDNSVWQQKFMEWQPGLQAIARNPVFGVGLGNYQNNINNFYQAHSDPFYNPEAVYDVTKPVANLMETGANSFYLVWLVETGFAGLLAFVWVLLWGITSAGGAHRRLARRPIPGAEHALDEGLALGALGALVAMAGGMFFAGYLVRGVGIAVVFVLATAAALRESACAASDA
jgi:hypothetical protein